LRQALSYTLDGGIGIAGSVGVDYHFAGGVGFRVDAGLLKEADGDNNEWSPVLTAGVLYTL
jgi:hypothetical protein